jgi:lactoylglutathione lyase
VIEIVKDRLDFGLLTDRPEVVDFWREEAGLRLDHVLPVGRGHDQHRFDVDGSVVKVNVLPSLPVEQRPRRQPASALPSG